MRMSCKPVFLFLVLCALSNFGVSQTAKPNVVFIISDQHKLEATGAYGSKLAVTPNIDELAKTGVKFTNCYSPAPVCAPARAALITGMYPYVNGAIYHKAPVMMPNGKIKDIGSGEMRETGYRQGIITLAEIFKEQGYATAAPGKMHVHGELQKNVDEDFPEGNSMGFDETSVRYYTSFPGGHYEDEVGEDTYMRYRQFKKYKDVYKGGAQHLNEGYEPTLVKNDEDNFDMVVARKSVEFINKRAADGKSFFLHVGFEKPHAPFTTTQKYLDMHNPSDFSLPDTYDDWYNKGKYPWSPNWVHSGIPKNLKNAQNVMAAYHACVTEMDDMVGRVVNALKEKGLYENTIIIYTTDHGEHLFEHGLRGKHNMYDDAVNIPFIISYPKLFKGNTVNNSLISLIDVMPTLAELIQGNIPTTAQGVSLVSALKNGTTFNNRPVFAEFRGGDYQLLPGRKNVPSRMMRKGDFKFIYTHGIINQLYHLGKDKQELYSLTFDENYAKVYKEMYFQTVVNWKSPQYDMLNATIKDNKVVLGDDANFKSYHLFYASDDKPEDAQLIAQNISSGHALAKKGYYWILADVNYTVTSKYYGDTVPVAVKEYSQIIPVSNALPFL